MLAFIRTKRAKKNGGDASSVSLKKIFPFFIIYFVIASVITTLVGVMAQNGVASVFCEFYNGSFVAWAKWLAKFFIAMAMCAIGLNTNIVNLIKKGGKPILLGFCCWVAITGVSLGVQILTGIYSTNL